MDLVPAAGGILADWGADVIKVENPLTGDPQRGLRTITIFGPDNQPPVNFMLQQSNRGKRSVGIAVATPEGLELLYRLVETSDVFLTSFRPSALKELKVDVEDLRRRNPKIIYVRGSGYGAQGTLADKGGYDATAYWARGGFGQALAAKDGAWPVGQRPGVGDLTSAVPIAGGIAAALFQRERTGEPSVVDVSLLGSAMWNLSYDIVGSAYVPKMMAYDRDEAPNPVVNPYRTADGRNIILIIMQSDRGWATFCTRAGCPELIDDPRFASSKARFENRRECIAALDKVFASRTVEEWREPLDGIDGAWDLYQTPAEILSDQQAIDNGYLPTMATQDGSPYKLVASPVQFNGGHVQPAPAPEHGEHTESVLLDMGLTWDELARFKESGVIL